jgi:hypothetical protein
MTVIARLHEQTNVDLHFHKTFWKEEIALFDETVSRAIRRSTRRLPSSPR